MKRKIHKAGYKMRSGFYLSWCSPDAFVKTSRIWDRVTCKKCLKKRPRA